MFFRKIDLALQYFIKNSLIGPAIEGWGSRKHHIHDDPKRPDITFLIIMLLDDLRSNIVDLHNKKITLPTFKVLTSPFF